MFARGRVRTGQRCAPQARLHHAKGSTTRMRFELTRAEPIGLAVQRLNHSATSSCDGVGNETKRRLAGLRMAAGSASKGWHARGAIRAVVRKRVPIPGIEPEPPG